MRRGSAGELIQIMERPARTPQHVPDSTGAAKLMRTDDG